VVGADLGLPQKAMSKSTVQKEDQTPRRSNRLTHPLGTQAPSTESCRVPDEARRPLASALHERSRFETFLADLSATFLSVSANRVDSQIVAGLRQIVEFLGIDRSGFGELVAEKNKIVITHSYEVPGVPPTPRIYVEAHWPDYASKVQEGESFRVPEDLPAKPPRSGSTWHKWA